MLTEKQKRFVDFFVETGNAAEAARKAGYGAKAARRTGARNLTKPYIKKAIDERLEELRSQRIANAQEVMEYLTSMMRGRIDEEVIVVESVGDGCSCARKVIKQAGARDRNKAAELLAKRYGLNESSDNAGNGSIVLNIVNDLG